MSKVLCCGDVRGRFDALFARVGSLNSSKHGPFDVLFCVGQTFSAERQELEQYLNGTKTAPVPTYFINGSEALPACVESVASAGGEICKNMRFLGPAGIQTISNLKVAYLSGNSYKQSDIDALSGQTNGVDVLLTSEWGRGIHLNAVHSLNRDLSTVGSPHVSKLACALKPRYHFCGTEGQSLHEPLFLRVLCKSSTILASHACSAFLRGRHYVTVFFCVCVCACVCACLCVCVCVCE